MPVQAPDSIPAWAQEDSNTARPSRFIHAVFRKSILIVQFRPGATQKERQAAIDLVSGTVVGGYGAAGIYMVRISDPGDGSRLVGAAGQLEALPQVMVASPDIELGLQ